MPSPYSRIACCVDCDDREHEVLTEGLRLADGSPGVVHAVHVIAPPRIAMGGPYSYVAPILDLREQAESWMQGLADELPGVTPVVLDGHPAREVCRWAEETDVDLIIAAAHRGVFERALLGGFASYLAYHAPCAVMLLHGAPVGAATR